MKKNLMKKFMNAFVGNGVHLTIRDGGNHFTVHTIQIMEKTDESCPVKELEVGDRFLRLLVRDENNGEAAILCNWSEQLLQNLLENHTHAKEAGCTEILMQKGDPNNPDNWLLLWEPEYQEKPTPYIN
ncbi:MAG: hypothetical protein O2V44_08165 [Candidatus Bathyarchaeota archaeon]|nr:hypothetical protein [Candidatus Bathyarchaeota archaeon]